MDGPIEGLHAADGAAEDEAELVDAERIEELSLGADVVGDGDEGEIRTIDFAGVGVDRSGACGAVAGADEVDAEDAIVFEIE
jgi:hypothetical protein